MKKTLVVLALLITGCSYAQTAINVPLPEGAYVSPYPFLRGRFHELNLSGKMGVVDTLNGIIIPPVFTQIELLGDNPESPQKFLFAVRKDEKIGFYSLEGKELQAPKFDAYSMESNGVGSSYITPTITIDDDNVRIGIMNFEGKILVPVSYTRLERLDGTLEAFHLIGTPQDRVGVVKNFETILLPPIYSNVYVQLIRQRNFLFVTDENERSGVFDNNGKIIVPLGSSNEYSDDMYTEGSGPVYFGFMAKKGSGYATSDKGIIIQPVYDNIERVQFAGLNFFQLTQGKKYGVADGEGKLVAPVQYQNVEVVQAGDNVFIIAKRKGVYGLLNAKGNEVVPFQYSWIEANVSSDILFSLADKGGEYSLTRDLKVVPINK
jgi:WG containing repeat